jgi:dTMP kinase
VKKGKFVVIEGTDGSGKRTQFELLIEYFKKEKMSFVEVDFPRYYDSPFGKLAGEYLKGEHGPFDKISGYMGVLPYMLDEYTWSRDIGRKVLEKGKWVISNRYFTANFGHQVAKQKGKGKKKLREWLWEVGFEQLGILKPDLVIFLAVDPQVCKELIKRKSKRGYLGEEESDEAEKSFRHQLEAYRAFLKMCEWKKEWVEVDCMQKGEILSPERVHKKIVETIKKRLR